MVEKEKEEHERKARGEHDGAAVPGLSDAAAEDADYESGLPNSAANGLANARSTLNSDEDSSSPYLADDSDGD